MHSINYNIYSSYLRCVKIGKFETLWDGETDIFSASLSFPSLEKEIKILRRRHQKIWDNKTPEIWLNVCNTHIFWKTVHHPLHMSSEIE